VIVVDASVLIAHLDEHDAQHARAVERLLEDADRPLGASPLTLAEVLVGPARQGRLDVARGLIADLGVHEISLGSDAPRRLASLRFETGLKLPDCCVLLAAQDADAHAVLTFDERLGRAAEALGLRVSRRPPGSP
jgi:predicted nucleic acid-binding protein